MELKRPDRRVWTVLAAYGGLSVPAMTAVAWALSRFHPAFWLLSAIWLCAVLGVCTVILPLRAKHARYGADDSGIVAVRGAFFVSRHRMRQSAIRRITVICSPIGRKMGFSAVWLAAAGSWLMLVGIPTAEADGWCRRLMRP